MPDKSLEGLLKFIDRLSGCGMLKTRTASARKVAVNRVFSVLNSTEVADVHKLDIEEVMERFKKQHGSKYSQATLTAYKGRVSSSLGEFRRWLENPEDFMPRVVTRERNLPANRSEVYGQVKPNQVDIPLRTDLTISVLGLPFDLNRSEAEKIASVVFAMVTKSLREDQ